MIGRRTLLLAAGAGVVAGPRAWALPVPPSDTLAFRMVRHGDEIGKHTLSFDQQGDALTVHVAVDALVTLLSVPIVRYTHRVVETWHGGTLMGLASDTDKNGTRQWAKAHRTEAGLVVTGSQTKEYVAPDSAIGTTYWNRRMMDGPMISLEDGVLLRPKVALNPTDSVRLASGGVIPAEHYSLTGAFNIDVWYDRTGTWSGLAFAVADGSTVHYERL